MDSKLLQVSLKYRELVYSNSPVVKFTEQLKDVLGLPFEIVPSLTSCDVDSLLSKEDDVFVKEVENVYLVRDQFSQEPKFDVLFVGKGIADDNEFVITVAELLDFDEVFKYVNFAFKFNDSVARTKFKLTKETK